MRRRESPANRAGLRVALADRYRPMADRPVGVPGWAAHWDRLVALLESDEPVPVYHWQLPEPHRPPAHTLGDHNAMYMVDADGSLTRVQMDHDGRWTEVWTEVWAEPDPRQQLR